MKITRSFFLFLIFAFGLFLSACGAAASATWPGLASSQDTAYVAFSNGVFAVNLKSGSLAWRFPATAQNGKSFYAAPVLTTDKTVLVGDFSNTLYGLDLNGTQKWPFDKAKSGYLGGPLVTKDGIYAPNSDGVLYALTSQGAPRWTFVTKHALWATPVTDGKLIYLTSMDHSIYAVQPEDGKQVWSTDLGGAINSSPALSPDGILYVGTLGKEVVAIKASNGQIAWRKPTDDAIWGNITLQNDILVFGDISGKIYGFKASDGSSLWSVPNQGGLITGGAAILPNGFAIGVITTQTVNNITQSSLINVDPQGNILWKKTINGKLYSSPVYAGDHVLVTVMEGDSLLVSFDKDGNQQWTFQVPK